MVKSEFILKLIESLHLGQMVYFGLINEGLLSCLFFTSLFLTIISIFFLFLSSISATSLNLLL